MAELLSPVDRPVDPVDPPPATTRLARFARFARAARRIGTVARANWLFLIVFGLGTVGRVLTMFAYSPALLYIDSVRH
ncbi:MAG TPA: hypothetical protein VGX23_19945 [Actinocrinis sp.]|nr:hypothetical protein [Actinocrinis sp.]